MGDDGKHTAFDEGAYNNMIEDLLGSRSTTKKCIEKALLKHPTIVGERGDGGGQHQRPLLALRRRSRAGHGRAPPPARAAHPPCAVGDGQGGGC